jgi:hypothetical protein
MCNILVVCWSGGLSMWGHEALWYYAPTRFTAQADDDMRRSGDPLPLVARDANLPPAHGWN